MALFQDTSGDPRAAASRFADVLLFYGAAGDAACGNPMGFAVRKASAAAIFSYAAELSAEICDAVYFAGILHAIGALGNNAYRKGTNLSEREARMQRWEVPAEGARLCASIEALPVQTQDLVRWQAEHWDGTGYPDQLRWQTIPVAAQTLLLADMVLRCTDNNDALERVNLESGRALAPELTATYAQQLHTGSNIETLSPPPLDALDAGVTDADVLLDMVADRIDAHNETPGRHRRISAHCAGAARELDLADSDRRALEIAARICGANAFAPVVSMIETNATLTGAARALRSEILASAVAAVSSSKW